MLRLRTASASLSTIAPAAVTHPLPLPCTFAWRRKINRIGKMVKIGSLLRYANMDRLGILRILFVDALN